MVDIRDFFGQKSNKGGSTPVKKKSASAHSASSTTKTGSNKRTQVVIELSDEDDQDKVPVKRSKTEPTSTTTSKHFTKSQSKAEPIAIDDDDDDDDDNEFLKELESLPKSKTFTRVSASISSSNANASANASGKTKKRLIAVTDDSEDEAEAESKPESKPKADPKPKKSPVKKAPAISRSATKANNTSTTTTTTTTTTVHDILAQIPDAELPEDIATNSGFDYRAFKQHQESLPQSSPDEITIPEGKPNCLTGLTIVFTGVLPNISREDSEQLAVKYGAKVTKSLSGKTTLVVLGAEAGPSKVKKIKQHKIKAIDQAGFLQLIAGMPEEGGDSIEAEKAREKREKEELKAQQDAEKIAKDEEQKAEEREKKIKQARANGHNVKMEKLDSEKLWTVKYAPSKLEEICGNKSSVAKLKEWLSTWQSKFNTPGRKTSDSEMKAVLIHGPPGIGKTTAAHLVANSLGYDVLEKNASDVRSQNLLKSGVGNVLDNTSIVGLLKSSKDKHGNRKGNGHKLCIIMDEVDGMSGGDRGGVGALASFARKTSTPLILICNDKSLPKMRPFDRCTLEIPFRRPTARDMKSRLMTIALREKIKLDPNVIDQLVQATGNDIRQIINLLSTVSMTSKSINSDNSKGISNDWQKNIALKPFDIIPRLLTGQNYLENSSLPLYKKMELYFDDHMFVPPMLQENYLHTRPMNTKQSHLKLVAQAADSISQGDLIDAKIHSGEQLWSLMPYHSIMSTVYPASLVAGSISGRTNFSAWFGQNSKTGKYQRLLTDIHYKSRLRTGTSQTELRLQYMPLLVEKLLTPLLQSGVDSVDTVIDILDYYYLTKTDYDTLMEYPLGRASTAAALKKIPTKIKSAFTRKYNGAIHPVAKYVPGSGPGAVKAGKGSRALDDDDDKKKKKGTGEDEEGVVEEDVDPEEEAVM